MARKIFFVTAPVCAVLVGVAFILGCTSTSPAPLMPYTERTGTVIRVIDGDTLVIGDEHIRLVGIDVPRSSPKAKEFVEKLCLGEVVCLNVDDLKPYDPYGRILAVVYVDGMNLNAELLRRGYAELWFQPPSEFNPYCWIE